ncbi:MAG TPA: cytochrome c3 family protein [Longimicrobiales bacterium]|nr:cytochrome c3 family protein [Longimicrobiales bacterium]
MLSWSKKLALLPMALLGAWAASACVDERIVYRDRDLFDGPLAAAGSFLGYTDNETKLTVCGNCHVEKQGHWIASAHADAWADLQANPGAQGFCEGCHTVNELGNAVTESAGYNATGEARYEDVQCESCHGPGLAHVTNPLRANAPLAPVDVGADLSQGCAQCHAGSHHPFADEWNLSAHGEGALAPQYRTRVDGGCAACHGAAAALESWGVRASYSEAGENRAMGITCAVCHDPHSADHAGQLRYSATTPDVGLNLCMQCHQKRSIPDEGTTSRGPHSPQGPLLLGEVGTIGWTPPNFAYNVERIRGTHGSERNTRLCAGCHINSYEVTDPDTGSHIFSVTGHRFLAVPCVDSNGVPTEDQSCPQTETERNFASCTTSGCHGDAIAARSALDAAEGRISDLVDELNALLAQVPATEFSTTDTIFTVAEGARFNALLGAVKSSATHNPFMTEALLRSSMDAVRDQYNLPAAAGGSQEEALRALVERWGH